MKRSNWVRLIAVILVISMMAAPVSAATVRPGEDYSTNSLIGSLIGRIRDIIRDIIDDWFDGPTPGKPIPTRPITPVEPTEPEETQPAETEPVETEPEETQPVETEPTEPETETVLNLVEGHKNTENGQLLRGVTYTLSQMISQQTTPQAAPYALRSNVSVMSTATPVSAKIEGITGTASSYNEGEGAVVANAFDGKTNTYWATPASGDVTSCYLIANLGTKHIIDKVAYTKRYDSTQQYNCTGNLLNYVIEVSTDGTNWSQVANGTTVDGTTEITFTAVEATHVRLTGTESYHWNSGSVNTVMAAAEFEVFGYVVEPENNENVTATNKVFKDFVDGGQYYIQGARAVYFEDAAYESENGELHTWLKVENGGIVAVENQSDATLWTVTFNENGTYELSAEVDGQTVYLAINGEGTENVAFSTNSAELVIENYAPVTDESSLNLVSDDGNLFRISDGTHYLNQSGGRFSNNYGGYDDEPNCPGNAYWLYRVTDDGVNKVVYEMVTTEVGTLIYFPVTMFNYDQDTINALTDAMDDDLTIKEGFYFSNGGTEVVANFTTVTSFPAGQYYIQNERAASNNVDSWLQAHAENKIYGVTQADATLWTVVVENGEYYLTCEINGETNYLVVGTDGDTDGYTTTKTAVSLQNVTGNAEGTKIGKDNYFLCQWGSATAVDYGGYNENANDPGNVMKFYAVVDDVVSDTPTAPTTTSTLTSGYQIWNRWAYSSNAHVAQNKFYSGLVESELVNDQIVFTVNEPGVFTYDENSPTTITTDVKDIYQNVGLPFVLNDRGYYTFNSDAHGTYFADTTGDGNSDPWYGKSDDYFNLYFDYGKPQGWDGINTEFGDGSYNLWAPFNTNTNDTGKSAIDYHFGMRADLPFSMTPNGRIKSTDDNSTPITFTFQGDDDVWIFIDGHLVIDLGGIHNRIGATIDFANNTITYFKPESNNKDMEIGSYNEPEKYPLNDDGTITVKLYNDAAGEGALGQTRFDFAANEEHEMSIFYLERGEGTSNCHIEFNLPMRDTVQVTKDITKSWSEAQDELDGDNGDGTQALTAKEQAAVDKLNFNFKLWKKEAGGEFTVVSNTNYFLLDKDGNVLGTYTTAADGLFTLKNGQTAKFMTEISKDGTTYYVEELDVDLDTFLTPDYNYAGLATKGFDYTGVALDTSSTEDNAVKNVSGHVSDASEIGEHELPMNATELKSYDVTAYGSIESIDSLQFICTNYLNADLPNPTARAYEDMIVIDYGLPVQIDPLANDVFRGDDIEIVAWGDESLELSEVLNELGTAIPEGTEGGTSWTCDELTEAPAGRLGANASYNGDFVDLADCLFTFTQNENGTWVISSTDAAGNPVYLQGYAEPNGYPVVSSSVDITIADGAADGTVTLQGNGGYLFFYRDGKNYFDRVTSTTNFEAGVSFYLYAEQEDGTYAPIAGKDAIGNNKQYLIVADAGNHGKFIVYPTTDRTTRYSQIAKLTTLDNTYAFDFGNVTFKDVTYSDTARDTFEYRLTEQLTEVEEIRYIIKVNGADGCRYALGKVYIAPATIMYYEENFSDMIFFEGAAWNADSTVADADNVSDFQEPGVVGTTTDSTYGSDVAYLSDDGDSNGTYRFADTTNKAARFTYTFTGTGTTIFARTSANTGYIQVKLYNGDSATGSYKTYYVDTYWKDENATELDASGILYNIPVFTIEDLSYGTYTIVCTVAKAGTITENYLYDDEGNLVVDENGNPVFLGSGNEFYLDGIRVMQPLNESGNLGDKALAAYDTDDEANLDTVTLRKKLINDVENTDPFAVLTDIDGAVNIEDFSAIGPNEEVYLAPGQKVTFSLKSWQPEGLKLYMGMKAPFGTGSINVGHRNVTLNNAPDCYYNVTSDYESLVQETDESGNTYYVVTYTFEVPADASCIVSLTNIKVVGNYEFIILPKTTNE